jgi:hypothetical protein
MVVMKNWFLPFLFILQFGPHPHLPFSSLKSDDHNSFASLFLVNLNATRPQKQNFSSHLKAFDLKGWAWIPQFWDQFTFSLRSNFEIYNYFSFELFRKVRRHLFFCILIL